VTTSLAEFCNTTASDKRTFQIHHYANEPVETLSVSKLAPFV
jgi:hypothetical protein